jgi:hypothetical protein
VPSLVDLPVIVSPIQEREELIERGTFTPRLYCPAAMHFDPPWIVGNEPLSHESLLTDEIWE